VTSEVQCIILLDGLSAETIDKTWKIVKSILAAAGVILVQNIFLGGESVRKLHIKKRWA
jgi:predicted AAA+ superfamily ATPase